MKIVLLTGSQPRHLFLASSLAGAGLLARLVIEEREEFVPAPPEDLEATLATLWKRHFEGRAEAEARHFGRPAVDLDSRSCLRVQREGLNGPQVGRFVAEAGADLALSYGVHLLEPETLDRFPEARWNLHGGLSPWYRGVITHFWPSYMLEPQMTGMTVHELTQALDGGPIVHHVPAPLVRGDGVHDLACRAVKAAAGELPELARRLAAGTLGKPVKQKSSGKLWVSRDWRPEHLRLVYEMFADRIVDAYLDGKLARREPDLVRQF